MSRRVALVLVTAFIAFLAAGGTSIASSTTEAAVDPGLELGVASAINDTRATAGLHELSLSPRLGRSARAHALSMARLGFFGHSSADGTGAVPRIASFYPAKGTGRWAVGEIILWQAGSVSASQALEMWLASAPHRRELFATRWQELGVAAVHQANAQGAYGGYDVTIVVVDFGAR